MGAFRATRTPGLFKLFHSDDELYSPSSDHLRFIVEHCKMPAMLDLKPQTPKNLNLLARELLESLAGHPEAAEIVLGGGVALSHYLEYRDTVDVNAWWRVQPEPAVFVLVEQCMKSLAERHGLSYRHRKWGETESLELLRGSQKQFSFQISKRTLYLDQAISAEWQPVWIETLRDNVGSKMTALVERGAPRDLRDIFELCTRCFITKEECWQLWCIKNPERDPREGPEKVLFHIERLELQRPLEKISSPTERNMAAALREWFRKVFCATS